MWAWIYEAVAAFYICLFCGCIMSFFLGSSLILISILKDVTNDLSQLNMCYDETKGMTTDESYRNLNEQFRIIVETFGDVKQLSIHTTAKM